MGDVSWWYPITHLQALRPKDGPRRGTRSAVCKVRAVLHGDGRGEVLLSVSGI